MADKPMSDAELQRRLNKLAKDAQALHKEAKRRYGPDGSLFFEGEGTFYIMDGDAKEGEPNGSRQSHIRFYSDGYCGMGCGAW